ncbi:cell division protein FtsA [Salegentibacter mishustinae]|uniref:cell division protein FtsA n=1 Tax=Salegentibacter mishustinae TaxID=270918 RepID=UPI002491A3FB|nr:cell division protein FtsA [Salegentibacter mishustinae]
MAKVFRFHNEGQVSDWGKSKLQEKHIDQIKDPNGASASTEITSIPSPFARIDLVKTAFREVTKSGDLSGDSIYHKMVSDALDIGQIFFNVEKYSNDIEIISWDANMDLNALINSNNPQHQTLGRSLQLYLVQDAKGDDIYNFSALGQIYLLNYLKGPNPLNIIGGTSPATLFFTSANKFDLKGFEEEGDKMLDNIYRSLNLRDPEYVKYIFALQKSSANFAKLFPELDSYLNFVYQNLNDELLAEIRSFNPTTINQYPDLNIGGGGNSVKVLGLNLKKAKPKTGLIQNSDFVINTEKCEEDGLPLVLPNTKFNKDLTYINSLWDENVSAPSLDLNSLESRKLPVTGDIYPYLTISDFLEPVIIRAEFPIDKKYFLNGGYKSNEDDDKGFLLPIKPLYFKYFDADSLTQTINGEKRFELKPISNGYVEAILRVPVQKGHNITFRRTYNNPVNKAQKPVYDESANKGAIIENRLNLGITPFYKFPNNLDSEYNIAFYDADRNPLLENNKYQINFFNSNSELVDVNSPIQRRKKEDENLDMLSYVVRDNFSFLQLSHLYSKGILVPKFEKVNPGVNKFTFAIDFGTTNTHVEYKVNNGQSQPFEINFNENWHSGQLINSAKYDEAYLKRAKDDLIPEEIGKNSSTGFNLPQRTSIAYHRSTNFLKEIISMGNVTIPFKYEKASFDLYTEVKTNLKWNSDDNSRILMKVFFEQLVKMIRNKILLNNGNPAETEIIWSYPASMSTGRLNQIEAELKNTIKTYIGSIQVKKVCESLTPYYYYVYEEGKSALVRPTVSIDIGGGTSDVAIYENNIPVLFTSYKFAGDAIFGDNYNRSIKINGFVQKYYDEFSKILDANEPALKGIILSIKERNNSNDAINALFSLEENKQLLSKKLNISFLDKLRNDDEFKVIFLIFFMAHIFHIAKIFKSKNLQVPAQFAFSGTASKLLTILDASDDKSILKDLIKRTFKKLLHKEEIPEIEILWASNPKELSSKGSLHINQGQNINVKDIKEVLIAEGETLSNNPDLTYQSLNGTEMRALKEYDEFLDFFFNLNKDVSYKDLFGIETGTLEMVKELLNKKKENHLRVGIEQKIKENGNTANSKIDETLFFYPLTGSLGEIAYTLYKKS